VIRNLGERKPSVHSGAFVHEAAVVIGDVRMEEGANVWPGAVLRGDVEKITIGRGASIQDCTVVHTDPGFPVSIGDWTTVAHGCVIHGCRVGKQTLIAMGAIVLTGAEVGDNCIFGVGALVPEGRVIPNRSIAMDMPAKVVRKVEEKDLVRIRETNGAYQKLMRMYLC
jgi:carbonic anhydrase/acetyltransferase-like protein (isoleucine patch superfamily)